LDTPSDLARVAQVLEDRQLTADAIPVVQKAVRLDEANPENRRNLAKLLVGEKRYDEALAEFERLRASGVEVYAEEAEERILDIYAAQGVLRAKIEELAEKCKADQQNADLAERLARLLYKARDAELAVDHLQRAMALKPQDVRLPRMLAKWYEEQHWLKLAAEAYRKLVAMDKPRASEYYRKLARLCIRLNDPQAAIEAAAEVAKLRPRDPQAFLELAKIQAEVGRFEDAEGSYRQAIRLAPDAAEYRREFGEALKAAGRLAEAANEFRQMMELGADPDTKMAGVRKLTETFAEMGKLDELAQELTARIRRSPGEPHLHYALATVHRTALEPEKEQAAYQNALRSLGNDKTVLKELFNAAYEAGDMAAVTDYAERLDRAGCVWSAQEREKIGQAWLERGDIGRAVQQWQKMVDPSTADPKAYRELADVLRAAGQDGDAAIALAKAVEMDREDFRARFDYATCLALAGQRERAVHEFLAIFEMATPAKLDKKAVVKPLAPKAMRLPRDAHGR
ncbi:MAG: tetratricopeptide repeat protein, partial [Planctomycetes bacterium]|nr:tetratricopeptide repeat protein [Planctomycetota bacterium]